jgi:hypothetical protein
MQYNNIRVDVSIIYFYSRVCAESVIINLSVTAKRYDEYQEDFYWSLLLSHHRMMHYGKAIEDFSYILIAEITTQKTHCIVICVDVQLLVRKSLLLVGFAFSRLT